MTANAGRLVRRTAGHVWQKWTRTDQPLPDLSTPTLETMLRVVFTEGMCPVLAFAFYSLDPDRFMVVEVAHPDEDDWHVAVQERDGTVWDINGPQSPAAFEERWGEFGLIGTDDRMDALWAAGDWQGLADHLTAPDPCFGLDGGVCDNIWAVTCDLARHILARGPL